MNATVGAQVRSLCHRAGIKFWALRIAAGLSGPSGMQSYCDPARDTHIPVRHVKAWLPELVGKGEPPITEDEVWALAGIDLPRLTTLTPAEQDELLGFGSEPALKSWQCHLCNTVWAPHVDRCGNEHR